jgi:hypothetical protein
MAKTEARPPLVAAQEVRCSAAEEAAGPATSGRRGADETRPGLGTERSLAELPGSLSKAPMLFSTEPKGPSIPASGCLAGRAFKKPPQFGASPTLQVADPRADRKRLKPDMQ